MDPALVSQPTGIIGWLAQYGQYVAFFAQIVYWIAMIIILGYAVAQYKRWVNFQLGTGKSGQLRQGAAAASKEDKAVSVEEFVD